ncbi:MAG: hypothetical protein PHW00_01090 [Clostridia bacterium]|nr:hypothetical protein [Clostridia bacterium]
MLKYKLEKCRSLKQAEKIINNFVKLGWKLDKLITPNEDKRYILVFIKEQRTGV